MAWIDSGGTCPDLTRVAMPLDRSEYSEGQDPLRRPCPGRPCPAGEVPGMHDLALNPRGDALTPVFAKP